MKDSGVSMRGRLTPAAVVTALNGAQAQLLK
jgi:hypothetical protein